MTTPRSKTSALITATYNDRVAHSNPSDNTLKQLLTDATTIAMVGASSNPDKASYGIMQKLQNVGYRVIPVNPRYDKILGERCHPTLATIEIPVDIVDVFRRSEDVMPIAEEAIAIGAKCLWQQIGVRNGAAAALAASAGLEVVMNRCVKIEHGRLFGGLNWAGVNTGVISARRPV